MGMMKEFREFREFAMRGSVVDLAVGVVIGAAFGKIVTSFVANIVMPPLNLLTAKYGVNFTEMAWKVNTLSPELKDGKVVQDAAGDPNMIMQPYPILQYGPLIQTVVDFMLVAIAIFIAIKLMNAAKAKFEKEQVEEKKVKSCGECKMEIPIEATRCGHCTSQVST